MTEIKQIEFSSEAYMPQTYFQMTKKGHKEGKIGIRLSNRKDSYIFNLQSGESIIFETDTGGVPAEFDTRQKEGKLIKIPEIPWKHENGRWVKIK